MTSEGLQHSGQEPDEAVPGAAGPAPQHGTYPPGTEDRFGPRPGGADQGWAPSMNHYGNLLRKENPSEALQWHRKAAEAGEPYAMENLARAYYEGIGTAKDLPQAAEWSARRRSGAARRRC